MKTKYTRFADIPTFTERGSWECDFDFEGVLQFIKSHTKDGPHGGLDLNPDFQRGHVWTEKQQVAWLEFFLRGGKTGRVLYFNKPSWNHQRNVRPDGYDDFVIVDGKQRIEAVRRFLENEIKVFGSWFREYTDFPRTLKINVNDLPTREAVLRWYCEMNAGGTPHSDAELAKVRKLLAKERKKAL